MSTSGALRGVQRQARWLLVLQLAPLVPGGILLLLALVAERLPASVGEFATAYWWMALGSGGITFLLLGVMAHHALRCPRCRQRFARAGIGVQSLADPLNRIQHCPQCGQSLH